MKPVLLATDGSPTAEKATATAIDLARLLGTEIVIVSVWDVAYAGYSAMGFAPIPMNADLARLCEEEASQGHCRSGRARRGGRRRNTLGRPAWFPRRGDLRRGGKVRSAVPRHRLARLGSDEASALRERLHRCSPPRDMPGASRPGGEGRDPGREERLARRDHGLS